MRTGQEFAGEVVTFVGRLLTLSRKRAAELVTERGGLVESEVSPNTTLVVTGIEGGVATSQGAAETDAERKLRRVTERVPDAEGHARILDEDAFCERAHQISPTTLRSQYYACTTIRGMYPAIRDEHLRYLEKWGLLRSVVRTPGDTWYGFADLAVIKQAGDEIARGADVKAILRTLAAEREGQLALDFHARADAPRVVQLAARDHRSSAGAPGPKASSHEIDAAEVLFIEASKLDTGEPAARPAAMAAYRRVLLLAPQLVPAMINLGNLHYAEDHLPEAQALYFEAVLTDPDCFEGHYNLANLLHDLGRFKDAESCYREAVRIDPRFADAHFYLAVTLEKQARSQEARPHWRRYQELAPGGEWIELAKEFTE